ncbi:MAG: hypothetical protein RL223_2104 [Pseudomonadota bacterium]
MAIQFQFLPWVRRGLAATLAGPDTMGALPAQATATIGVRLDAAHAAEPLAPVAVRLQGPGDVLAIDTQLIVRTDPRPGTTQFEPNYLAMIEFDPPDYPWLLTPARADADDRLRPWLVLLVLEQAKVGLPRPRAGAPLPQIRIAAADAATELPPLTESWSWAHAQVLSAHGAADREGLQADLQGDPRSHVSRLVCPRRLRPDTDYLACVVPAFEPGRLRGLGLAGDGLGPAMQTLAPAWTPQPAGDVVLPVYHHWTFSTGPQGDFESLARRLRTPAAWRGDAAIAAQLAAAGTAPLAVDPRLDGGEPAQAATMAGALVPLGWQAAAQAAEPHARSLQAIVNTPAQRVRDPAAPDAGPPEARLEVKPPLYGAWHARTHAVQRAEQPAWWLAGLNLSPAHRGAAGLGAEVVRRNQEDYADACWAQIGEVQQAERLLNLTRLAIEAQQALQRKHFDPQPPERLLQLMAPALPRIEAIDEAGRVIRRIDGRTASLGGVLDRSSLPAALLDAGLRRAVTPLRRGLRLAARHSGQRGGLATLAGHWLQTMARAGERPAAFALSPPLADGILHTALFDGLDLPARLSDAQRLTSRQLRALGLPAGLGADGDVGGDVGGDVDGGAATGADGRGGVTVGQVRALMAAGRTTRERFTGRALAPPPIRAAQRGGVIADRHVERLGRLAAEAPGLTAAELGELTVQIERQGRLGVEALLVEAPRQGGLLQVSALGLDARSGTLRIDRPLLRLQPGQAPQRAPAGVVRALSGATLGQVATGTARGFGNVGLLASLPPGVIDLQGRRPPAQLTLDATLVWRDDATQPPDAAVASITVPPALRQRTVLRDFATATRGLRELLRDPLREARLTVQPVDFPLQRAAAALRARTRPEQVLGARLRAQLRIADQALPPAGRSAAGAGGVSAGISAGISARLPATRQGWAALRYVVPALADRVMAYPRIAEPMYQALARLDPEAFMPGIGQLPQDLVMLVQVNQAYIDAFMVGANSEMNRELLWRGFPTDQRGTPIQRFWDRRHLGADGRAAAVPDIDPIHLWRREPLGHRASDPNTGDPDRVVLLVRGQLLRRYPNALVYAWRREVRPGRRSRLKAAPDPVLDQRHPVFGGPLPPDLQFFGFDIPRGEIADWCFVIEEPMGEPRFGFDVDVAPPVLPGQSAAPLIGPRTRVSLDWARAQLTRLAAGAAPDADFQALRGAGFNPWQAVSWSQLPVAPGGFVGMAALAAVTDPAQQPFADLAALSPTPTAAEIAHKLLQLPFRAYWEGPDLAPAAP